MNVSINENIQLPTEQQSIEQSVLLKAIRKKFENKESHSGTSPPVFSIPNLKLPQCSLNTSSSKLNDETTSNLNEFIFERLGESKALTQTGSFVIPDLNTRLNGSSPTLAEKLHLNSITLNENKISYINKGISSLRVSDEDKIDVIDLTTALNQCSTFDISPANQTPRTSSKRLDFQIPFIDCDLKDTTLRLPLRDEHCQTDVSNFVHTRFMSAPSKFGKITCLRYRLPKRSDWIDHSFEEKNKIARFRFDTKSPDDIVLASIRRYNRV